MEESGPGPSAQERIEKIVAPIEDALASEQQAREQAAAQVKEHDAEIVRYKRILRVANPEKYLRSNGHKTSKSEAAKRSKPSRENLQTVREAIDLLHSREEDISQAAVIELNPKVSQRTASAVFKYLREDERYIGKNGRKGKRDIYIKL